MGRKMNPKSQENDRQNHSFLQIPLLQIGQNVTQINSVRVLHGGLLPVASLSLLPELVEQVSHAVGSGLEDHPCAGRIGHSLHDPSHVFVGVGPERHR